MPHFISSDNLISKRCNGSGFKTSPTITHCDLIMEVCLPIYHYLSWLLSRIRHATLSAIARFSQLAHYKFGILKIRTRFNTLRTRQNGWTFADDFFECIYWIKKMWISISISLKCVPRGPINNILALVQIIAWHRPGDKPLYETMMASLLTHNCVTRPQWLKSVKNFDIVVLQMT